MIQFGICTTVERSAEVRAAGWDFVEETILGLLQGTVADEEWNGEQRARGSVLPIPAANMLVPASLKITGPEASLPRLEQYLTRVMQRAAAVGMHILVFGSGGARSVPEGFDRKEADKQILAFAQLAAALAAQHGITVVVEALNRRESNIINSIAEAMAVVNAVNHPNLQCLLDSYHLWLEDEPVESVREAIASIRHVHLADKEGRMPPGESGRNDYRPLFAELKRGAYDGMISIEPAKFDDIKGAGPRVLAFLKKQWQEA